MGKRARHKRAGQCQSQCQCLPRLSLSLSLRASITAESSPTLPRLRQPRTGPNASRSTFSSSRLDSCARGNLAAAPISHIFDSAVGREECMTARGGRLTHAFDSGSECDGLAVKHRHTHSLTHSLTRRAEPVGELALKADQIRAARREKQQRHEQRSKQRATSER